jgi:hypothetical protein
MPEPVQPGANQDSLADVVELLLDKGIVINADIVVSVGQTELLGIRIRAAIASFETAAEYGLEFPAGTDMEAVESASGKAMKGAGSSPSANPSLAAEEDESEESGDEDEEADENADEGDRQEDDDSDAADEAAAQTAEATDDDG